MRKIVKQSKSHKNRLEIDISSSWIEYLDIKMSVLPQLIYKINTIPIKMQKCFFSDKLLLKFIWRNKHARIT